MKIRILGSGTSNGVPQVGCQCEVCTSPDPRDRRLRTSVWVEEKGTTFLLDCGPDFREQALSLPYQKIDGVLLTHEHYDHVGGIDDLRPFCPFGEIPLFTGKHTADKLRERLPYCFTEVKYPGVPVITLREVDPGSSFYIKEVKVVPIEVMHGKWPILGYRIGDFAYLTDMTAIAERELAKLEGVKVLVMNALRIKSHPTHQSLEEALERIKCIRPEKSFLIHMSHAMGRHTEVSQKLPPSVYLAYDGMEVEW